MANESNQLINNCKRKPLHLIIGALLVLFGAMAVLSGVRGITDDRTHLYAPEGRISIEKAVSPEQRRQGLSNRQSLDSKNGMIFVFESSDKHCFWMKDTFIPLDMVWLDENKKVVYVYENAKVESEEAICPDKVAAYVLEVNAGQADKLGLEIGASVRF